MTKLDELQTQYLDLNNNLNYLQKAFDDMQTAQHADAVMSVEYDPEIIKRIIEQTPFTEFLRAPLK